MGEGPRSRRLASAVGVRAILAAFCAFACVLLAPSAYATTQTFTSIEAEQTYTVPAGVSSVHVVAVGANGEEGGGGLGATVSGDLRVSAGQRLYVELGGEGELGGKAHLPGHMLGGPEPGVCQGCGERDLGVVP